MDKNVTSKTGNDLVLMQSSMLGGVLSIVCVLNLLELKDSRLFTLYCVALALNCASAFCAYIFAQKLESRQSILWAMQILLCPAFLWLGFSLEASARRFSLSAVIYIALLEVTLILLTTSLLIFPFSTDNVDIGAAEKYHKKRRGYHMAITVFSFFLFLFSVARQMDVFVRVILSFVMADILFFLAVGTWKAQKSVHTK